MFYFIVLLSLSHFPFLFRLSVDLLMSDSVSNVSTPSQGAYKDVINISRQLQRSSEILSAELHGDGPEGKGWSVKDDFVSLSQDFETNSGYRGIKLYSVMIGQWSFVDLIPKSHNWDLPRNKVALLLGGWKILQSVVDFLFASEVSQLMVSGGELVMDNFLEPSSHRSQALKSALVLINTMERLMKRAIVSIKDASRAQLDLSAVCKSLTTITSSSSVQSMMASSVLNL